MKNKSKRNFAVRFFVLLGVAVIILAAALALCHIGGLGAKPQLNISCGVVIDAGHGGADPGAISTISGAHEDDMNLRVAEALETELESRGILVFMMRSDGEAVGATKQDDMAFRREFTNSSGAAAFVSIHMNSFPDNPSVWGPQVFYDENSASSRAFAAIIQDKLNAITGGARQISADDLYVLREAPMPAVLIECGFITNADEEALLHDEEYIQSFVCAVADALEAFFG